MGAIRHISRQGGGSGGSGGGVDFRTGGLYVDVFMVIFLADVLWVYSLLEVCMYCMYVCMSCECTVMYMRVSIHYWRCVSIILDPLYSLNTPFIHLYSRISRL